MAGEILCFLIFFSFFVFLIFVIISKKNELKILEYQEWLYNKGFIKVKINFFCNVDIEDNIPYVIKKENMICYMQFGVYSFIVGKSVYSEISVYPEFPENKDDVKKTKTLNINTVSIKSVDLLSD